MIKDDINRGGFIDRQRAQEGICALNLPQPDPAPNVLRASSPPSESLEQTICVIKCETMTQQHQLYALRTAMSKRYINSIIIIVNLLNRVFILHTKQKLSDYENNSFVSLNHNVENKGSK